MTLPEIDYRVVAQKISAKMADQILQTAALENLAESLRTQRDEAAATARELQEAANKTVSGTDD
jgi:hypothetical protein